MNYKKSHHSKVSSEMIARGKLLDLKHKVLEAAYDHYGADLGEFISRIAKSAVYRNLIFLNFRIPLR